MKFSDIIKQKLTESERKSILGLYFMGTAGFFTVFWSGISAIEIFGAMYFGILIEPSLSWCLACVSWAVLGFWSLWYNKHSKIAIKEFQAGQIDEDH